MSFVNMDAELRKNIECGLELLKGVGFNMYILLDIPQQNC